MERRTFLKNAAALGAGLSVITPARTARAAATPHRIGPNERIQIGLIGARNMGGGSHLPSLVKDPEVQLVGICDVDQLVLEEAMGKARTAFTETGDTRSMSALKAYRDFRELLQRDDLDAVLIATPDHWHVPMAKAAVKAGKDVFVEKPLSHYVQEGRELADLAKHSKAIVQVGSQQRSGDRFLIACGAVQAGLLGELQHIEVGITTREGSNEPWEPVPVPRELDYDMWVGPAPWCEYHPDRTHYNFRFVPEFSGGDLANWAAHHLDIAQLAMGTSETGPVFVEGRGRRHGPGSKHTSYYGVDVDYRYASGVTLKLRSHGSHITFVGSEGTMTVGRGDLQTTPEDLIRTFPRGLQDRFRKTKGSHRSNWYAAMRSRKVEDLHAPVEVGHRSATLCHLANIAMEVKRPLHWDPEREIFKADAFATALLNRPVRDGWVF